MKIVNLKDYYLFYTSDYLIDISDEIAELLQELERQEATYRRRIYRNKAYYSLDRNDGIEHDVLFSDPSPCEVYERKVMLEQLYKAISSLPEKQVKRIYAYYFLGMSKAAIARAEGVGKTAVGESIARGLKGIRKFLKEFSD